MWPHLWQDQSSIWQDSPTPRCLKFQPVRGFQHPLVEGFQNILFAVADEMDSAFDGLLVVFTAYLAAAPVSYTHLDVYKRQVALGMGDGDAVIHIGRAFVLALIPVSYTHLDVYKRQEQLTYVALGDSIVSGVGLADVQYSARSGYSVDMAPNFQSEASSSAKLPAGITLFPLTKIALNIFCDVS